MTVDFLTAIIEHVAHPIFVKDREFRFVLLNRAFCQLAGYPAEDMLGKTDYDFFPAAEADFFRAKDAEMFASRQTIDIDEERITDASGCVHVLATTKVPLRGASGKVTHLVGIIHDNTRLKAAEEGLRQANDALERRVQDRTAALAAAQEELVRKERLAVLGQLAGGVAHQIRNPLGAIANAAYLLRRQLSSDEASTPLAVILEEVSHANRIITDIIDYARVRPPVRRPTPVRRIVEQALGARPVGPGIAVRLDLPGSPLVAIDEDQVRGALDNLICNAIDAMPDGGALTFASTTDANEVVLSVTDTGTGMPAEVKARLFEPLVTTKPLGLGLGLTTARSLIENQGGSLRCESALGAGTRFEVRLPTQEGG